MGKNETTQVAGRQRGAVETPTDLRQESETTTDDRVKQAFFIVEPNREQLTQIGELLAVIPQSKKNSTC